MTRTQHIATILIACAVVYGSARILRDAPMPFSRETIARGVAGLMVLSFAVGVWRSVVFDGMPAWLRGWFDVALAVAIACALWITQRGRDVTMKLCGARERLHVTRR